MKLSTDRILTTHVGSLPRPQPLVELLIKKDRNEAVRRAEFAAAGDAGGRRHRGAPGADRHRCRQRRRDEQDRLCDLCARTPHRVRRRTVCAEAATSTSRRFPDFRRRLELFIGPQQIRRLCCIGPIARQDHESAQRDIDNFKAAIAASKPVDAFMPAASPGVVSTFQPNRHYPNHAAYIDAIARCDAGGIRGDRRRRHHRAARQPRSGDGAAHAVPGPDRGGVPEAGRAAGRGAEPCAGERAGKLARLHLCWGNYEGPHDFDIPLREDPADRS